MDLTTIAFYFFGALIIVFGAVVVFSKTIEELFLSLKDKYTIVLVTHTLRQAKRIADYVAFMYMGELIEFGTADQVFNHPKHKLTKEYISGGFS